MKRISDKRAEKLLSSDSIKKAGYIGDVDYQQGAKQIGYNHRYHVELWLVDDNYTVLIQK